MSLEQSKAAKRRFDQGAFHSRYFVGHGIDIGGKPDPLGRYAGMFAQMQSVRTWDLEDGDAQHMAGVLDDTYDFLHSSHCLEHMIDAREALANWIRIVKPGGYLVVTVPDEDLYEQGRWPSAFNPNHKWSFTIYKRESNMPQSVNVLELLMDVGALVDIEKIELQRDFYPETLPEELADHTKSPVVESSIEFVLRKRQRQ